MHARATTPATDLYTFMVRSHEHLDALYGELLAAMEANAPDVRAIWTRFDHELMSHMEAEERFVLPTFARLDAGEALSLLREHGLIRAQLLELGVAVDLHLARYTRALELVELLRAHAGREDHLLYRWADQNLDSALVAAALAHASA
ncbi:MAG TPA: hemerythrin domain-containing protein [Kofleriaceae bacterium]|nr:hemerythrin domain-containing protein [Kofleriaceae bacterium]